MADDAATEAGFPSPPGGLEEGGTITSIGLWQ